MTRRSTTATTRRRSSTNPATPAPDRISIVGIGASAGGLEALERFMKNLPEQTGLAFVVVQHMDPTHTGMLPELLQRVSKIPVVQITDRLPIEADHVYVIPPNEDLSVLHGVLHLLTPIVPRGLRLSIDFFFRSLADDLGDRSIGVILSGMGSDGTQGLRAIREQGGATFVQAPSSAKFDGMPSSAIGAGLADVVAPVEELPKQIIAYRKHAVLLGHPPRTATSETLQSGVEKTVALLRASTGQDFSLYKNSTLHRRIQRRMSLHQIVEIDRYVRYLRENPREAELLFKEMLIGVTSFFRDPAAWEALGTVALPALLAARPAGGALRAWVTGCSTGEEAYSLAIAFREALDTVAPTRALGLQIFATDLDADAVERARRAFYPASIAANVSPERLERFFVEEDDGYRLHKQIRDMVVFATQNLIQDPPFTKLDLLTCRNLLIYLNNEPQQKLMPLFHYCLRPNGILFLGSAETVGGFTGLFTPVDRTSRLYRRVETGGRAAFELPSVPEPPSGTPVDRRPPALAADVQTLAERFLLQRFAPAAVLTSATGDVVCVSGRTGKYLELPAGKANWNILAMAREDLRAPLTTAFREAIQAPQVVRRGVPGRGARRPGVELVVEALREPEALRGMMLVVFGDPLPPAPAHAPANARRGTKVAVTRTERERDEARDELRTTREEMQTAQEELQSTNEELQSTNEELQSTNEELTTSKEEMQSMNEELQTLNHELQVKVDDLSLTTNDMNNLLNSTEIAVLFLDDKLRVRRFTPQMSAFIRLIPGDVGRPLADLASSLSYPQIYDDAREVLRSLIFNERTVASSDGRWFSVRIMPYRTSDNRIDGVVITFTNVTALKKLEASLVEPS